MNGRHTRQGGRFADDHRVLHAHTQTVHNRACGSLAARTSGGLPRRTASNHGTRFDSSRWGLRGDYRFGITRSKDDAPEFFGRDTRYIHRFYGGVIINMVR